MNVIVIGSQNETAIITRHIASCQSMKVEVVCVEDINETKTSLKSIIENEAIQIKNYLPTLNMYNDSYKSGKELRRERRRKLRQK